MLKSITNAFSICLQGTLFELRPKKAGWQHSEEHLWSYSLEGASVRPYVLTQEEYKIKNDLITKLHSVDNRLQASRSENRRSRAKWLPDLYEQTYDPPRGTAGNPQVELYYRVLGLSMVRDPRSTWQKLMPVRPS